MEQKFLIGKQFCGTICYFRGQVYLYQRSVTLTVLIPGAGDGAKMVDVPKILKDLYAERDLIVEVITMLEKLNTTAVTEPAAMESRTSRDSKKKRAAQPKGTEKAASKPAAKRAVKATVTAPALKPKAKKKELSPAARKRAKRRKAQPNATAAATPSP
jgi:hypothetical protein